MVISNQVTSVVVCTHPFLAKLSGPVRGCHVEDGPNGLRVWLRFIRVQPRVDQGLKSGQ